MKMSKESTDPKNFEGALALLEDSVARLETGSSTLEESLQIFEQGIAASQVCNKILNQTRKRVQVLVDNTEGEFELEFLDNDLDVDSPT